tara:strand:- start:294 stop:452 length:159 start_codon:yes stop_codon:yes gene_type:complete
VRVERLRAARVYAGGGFLFFAFLWFAMMKGESPDRQRVSAVSNIYARKKRAF